MTGLLVAGLSLAGAAVVAGTAAADSERVRGYDAGVTIRADGTVAVVETIEYDFGGGQRHGLTRDIPDRGLTEVKVSSPSGAPAGLERSADNGLVHLRIGDPEQTVTGRQMYRISYVATAGLSAYDDRDELRWDMVGPGWRVPIDTAVVRVNAPGGVEQASCYGGGAQRGPCEQAMVVDDRTATFAQRGLEHGEGLVIVVGLAKGVVTVTRPTSSPSPGPVPPQPAERSAGFVERASPLSFGLGGLAVAGAVVVGLVAYRRSRNVRSADEVSGSERETSPPDGVPPALAGALRNGKALSSHLMATLVDLAVRGHLRIEETDRGDLDWVLVRLPEPPADDTLTAFEQRLLDQTFAHGGGRIRLMSLGSRLGFAIPGLHRQLNSELAERGWYTGVPGEPNKGLKYVGIALLLAGCAGFVVTLLQLMRGVAVVCAGVAVAGAIVWFASAFAGPRLTASGVAMRARVRAFKQYLTEVSEESSAGPVANGDRYLSYAMVFGLSGKWATLLAQPAAAAGAAGVAAAGGVWWFSFDDVPDGDLGPALADFCVRAGHALSSAGRTSGGSFASGVSGWSLSGDGGYGGGAGGGGGDVGGGGGGGGGGGSW